MLQYRVCKYDPKYRVKGVYTRNEWTSFADIGKVFDGRVFTEYDYEQAEQRHVDFLCALAEREGVREVTIADLELHDASLSLREGQPIQFPTAALLLHAILREDVWCRLEAPDFFIHFGYDYYLYVGCSFTPEAIAQLAQEHGLYAEPMTSPYHPEPEDSPPDLRPMTAIYLTRGDEILLLYRTGSRVVSNSYTGSAGGHMEPEEFNSARACVLRELREETGLTADDIGGLAMRYVTMRLKAGEIRQNYYFFATLREGCEPLTSNEGYLQWCPLAKVDEVPMPHTAKQVLRHYVREGRYTDLLYGAVSMADDAVFTPLTEF